MPQIINGAGQRVLDADGKRILRAAGAGCGCCAGDPCSYCPGVTMPRTITATFSGVTLPVGWSWVVDLNGTWELANHGCQYWNEVVVGGAVVGPIIALDNNSNLVYSNIKLYFDVLGGDAQRYIDVWPHFLGKNITCPPLSGHVVSNTYGVGGTATLTG